MQPALRLGLCALVAIVTISCSDRREARAWRITSTNASPAYYRDHLAGFPRGAHAAEAAAALALPIVDLLDAMDDGAVEAAMRFGRNNWMSINVRRASAAGLAVHVAPGTTFRSEDLSYERMVGVRGDTVILADTTTLFLAVPVLSMNLRRQRPSDGAAMTAERGPADAALQGLLSVLASLPLSHPTGQAAVWIVTDDADYADLGILTTQTRTISGGEIRGWRDERTIDERAAVKAMMICARAGIDITRKRIWRDRESLAAALTGSGGDRASHSLGRETGPLSWCNECVRTEPVRTLLGNA